MLKKLFLSVFAVFILAILSICFILFTQTGNNLIASYIENKVNEEQNAVTLSVKKLTLSADSLDFNAVIDDGSSMKINGGFNLFKQSVDLHYQLKIKELSYLAPLIGQKLQGPLNTRGTAKGSLAKLHIQGQTDVAQSQTQYVLTLIDRKPTIAQIKMQNAQIAQLLHLVDQPKYVMGQLNIKGQVDLSNLDQLKGNALLTIKNGQANSPLINKTFQQNLPTPTLFNLASNIKLSGQTVAASTDIKSNIANISAQKTTFNIQQNQLDTDYNLDVPDLRIIGKMFKQKVRGAIKIAGNAQFKHHQLSLNGHSNTLGGKLNFNLQGNQLVANLESLSLLKILHTFYYPKIFTSTANANIRYNLLTEKGDIVADLANGRFINSQLANVIQQLANFDITREIYQNIKLNSEINKKLILSNLNMQSKETQITMQQGQLNLANETLNMPLNVKVKKLLFKIGLSGDMRAPHITFDANAMARQKAEKEIQRGLNKLMKKHPKEGKILQDTLNLFNKKLF